MERHRQRWEVIGRGGEVQAAVESDRRLWGGTGSGGKRWEAVGRQWVAVESDGRQWGGTGSGGKR